MKKSMLSWGDAPLFFLVLALGLAQCARPDVAPAQAPARITEQLALARIGASECGLSCEEHELAAIAEVLRARAESNNLRFVTMARAYSGRVFDRDRSDGRRWIADLQPSGREPAGWPTHARRRGVEVEHLPWSAARDRWLALYEMAGRVARGEVHSRCVEIPMHWGMRSGIDHERARRAGWIEVDCGGTRNAFWLVPRADRD